MQEEKLLLTTLGGLEAAFLMSEDKLIQMQVNTPQDFRIGDIYIGRVSQIVPSIGAAFIQFTSGQKGFLPLSAVKEGAVLNRKNGLPLKCGDDIVVQIVKEPLKTKDATLTCDIAFRNDDFVLMPYSKGILYSKKLSPEQKDRLWDMMTGVVEMIFGDINVFLQKYGVIVRTNAATRDKDTLFVQLHELFHKASRVLHIASSRTLYSKLYAEEDLYLSFLRDLSRKEKLSIVTDQREVFEELRELGYENVSLYEDAQIDLFHLHGLGAKVDEALAKRVWLKSGGYLVIEPTEAMTVIDVNSGKGAGKKEMEEANLQLNLEAAKEIARQLRLRNISGIIIVDFINLSTEEAQGELIAHMRRLLAADPVDAVCVDMTALGLMEITRKKTYAPLHEKLRGIEW